MVRETLGNGFVVQIELLEINGNLITVWEGIDPSEIGTPVEFSVIVPRTFVEIPSATFCSTKAIP